MPQDEDDLTGEGKEINYPDIELKFHPIFGFLQKWALIRLFREWDKLLVENEIQVKDMRAFVYYMSSKDNFYMDDGKPFYISKEQIQALTDNDVYELYKLYLSRLEAMVR